MLKYENHNDRSTQQQLQQQLENVTLIDFQFCCWTLLAIDLQYFFNTSLNEDLR